MPATKPVQMKRLFIVIGALGLGVAAATTSCGSKVEGKASNAAPEAPKEITVTIDLKNIPNDKFGELVQYGRELMMNTARYIGPKGSAGHYTGNLMSCTNCHQDGGTKPFSFNLLASHDNYPQYRAREGKVLTLAERVNNCVTRPHNGKPLPLDSKEMVAFLAYLKWINSYAPKGQPFKGQHNRKLDLPDVAANPIHGAELFVQHCERCHGKDGAGQLNPEGTAYTYPPLWGPASYQPGSSMHRVVKQAEWLKNNMPYDKTEQGPFLSDADALDIAAFVNNDALHARPNPKSFDYPHINEKAIDYDLGPFADTFPASQHKYGPFKPIISYWQAKGWKYSL